jgi:hypothetical protein
MTLRLNAKIIVALIGMVALVMLLALATRRSTADDVFTRPIAAATHSSSTNDFLNGVAHYQRVLKKLTNESRDSQINCMTKTPINRIRHVKWNDRIGFFGFQGA